MPTSSMCLDSMREFSSRIDAARESNAFDPQAQLDAVLDVIDDILQIMPEWFTVHELNEATGAAVVGMVSEDEIPGMISDETAPLLAEIARLTPPRAPAPVPAMRRFVPRELATSASARFAWERCSPPRDRAANVDFVTCYAPKR